MATKPKTTTIAAAEKRVVKAEITTLKKAVCKIKKDAATETNSILRAHKLLDRQYLSICKATTRETKAATRRIAILEGRL